MGNCTASKLRGGKEEEEEDAVALCRERKRLLKSAVDRRSSLADSHAMYINSLCSVAGAVNLFVARHSSPTAPILITLPPSSLSSSPSSSPAVSDPSSFLRQTPSEPKTEALVFRVSTSSSTSSSSSASCSEAEEEGDGTGGGDVGGGEMGRSGFFFSGLPPPPPSPMRTFGWDFFNPFDGVRAAEEAVMMAGLSRSSDEDLRVVREEEGIPELEEEGEAAEKEAEKGGVAVVGGGNGVEVAAVAGDKDGCGNVSGREKGLTVVGTPGRERELLEALKDVEDHFIRAYDSGKDVARMLEASRVQLHSGVEDIKENSSKLIQAITWHRSPSSQSSSYKSSLASSSKDPSWMENKGDMFVDYGGMESGSHSQTLGRLYAWEKKLYEEVKAGDHTRRIYERKCSQLRNQDAKGAETHSVDKTRAAVKDLYTRIWVALRTAETISIRIQKLRDEELQPQLIELLQGLMKTWKIMLESHDIQNQIMSEVKSFTCPAYGKFCGDSQRSATLQLEAELQNWRHCFMSYVAAQRAYVEALDGWLSKFILPELEFYSRGRSSIPSYRVGAPPLLVICHDWLTSLEKLPDKAVSSAMKSFRRDVRVLWVKQGGEQQQKKKVDTLSKELDKRVHAFQRAENKVLESKLSEKAEPDIRQRVESLAGRKEQLDMFRKRLEVEKAKHQDCMEEKHSITLNGFKTGFTNIFRSLAEFSGGSLRMYGDLTTYIEKIKAADGNLEKPSCIEGTQTEVDFR